MSDSYCYGALPGTATRRAVAGRRDEHAILFAIPTSPQRINWSLATITPAPAKWVCFAKFPRAMPGAEIFVEFPKAVPWAEIFA